VSIENRASLRKPLTRVRVVGNSKRCECISLSLMLLKKNYSVDACVVYMKSFGGVLLLLDLSRPYIPGSVVVAFGFSGSIKERVLLNGTTHTDVWTARMRRRMQKGEGYFIMYMTLLSEMNRRYGIMAIPGL
jgi:hypothetical protein